MEMLETIGKRHVGLLFVLVIVGTLDLCVPVVQEDVLGLEHALHQRNEEQKTLVEVLYITAMD